MTDGLDYRGCDVQYNSSRGLKVNNTLSITILYSFSGPLHQLYISLLLFQDDWERPVESRKRLHDSQKDDTFQAFGQNHSCFKKSRRGMPTRSLKGKENDGPTQTDSMEIDLRMSKETTSPLNGGWICGKWLSSSRGLKIHKGCMKCQGNLSCSDLIYEHCKEKHEIVTQFKTMKPQLTRRKRELERMSWKMNKKKLWRWTMDAKKEGLKELCDDVKARHSALLKAKCMVRQSREKKLEWQGSCRIPTNMPRQSLSHQNLVDCKLPERI